MPASDSRTIDTRGVYGNHWTPGLAGWCAAASSPQAWHRRARLWVAELSHAVVGEDRPEVAGMAAVSAAAKEGPASRHIRKYGVTLLFKIFCFFNIKIQL
jgi:hypothetical protein